MDNTIAINMPSVLTASVHSHVAAKAAILEMDCSVKVSFNRINAIFKYSICSSIF